MKEILLVITKEKWSQNEISIILELMLQGK
jgi:hypothetical protein